MQIHCHTMINVSESVRQTIEREARQRFERFSRDISDVHVTVVDVNGPRGGLDIRCRVRLVFTRGAGVIVDRTADSVGRAVGDALVRASRTVARRTNRRKTTRLPSRLLPRAGLEFDI